MFINLTEYQQNETMQTNRSQTIWWTGKFLCHYYSCNNNCDLCRFLYS